MLYIRADANADIGMGHVMRCLSIAEAAAELDGTHKPVFLIADGGCRDMIEARGFDAIVLDTDYRDMRAEPGRLAGILDERRDVLLVDSYQADVDYFLALRKLARVACLEDMGFAYPVNLLINYNIYAPKLKERYQEQDGARQPDAMLLGADYVPLRKAFQEPSGYVVKNKVTDVIITTGGSDLYFAAPAFADTFLNNKVILSRKVHFHIISGPFNRFADELKRKYDGCGQVTVHENVKDMKSLLLAGDVLLTAAGSTVYEAGALGIPMIVFYFAENQRQGAEALAERTDIVNAGDFAKNAAAVTERAAAALARCMEDRDYRERLSVQEKRLIDGKGARRIARRLVDIKGDKDG